MEIRKIDGNRCSGDKKIYISTVQWEAFTMKNLATMLNQFSLNEKRIRVAKGFYTNKFRSAMLDAIKDGEKGLDWSEDELFYIQWYNKYFHNKSKVDNGQMRL